MLLNFSVDTEEMFDYEGDLVNSFEDLMKSSFRAAVIKGAKDEMASAKFSEFSKLTAENLINEIKIKLTGFLDEEIVLNDGWGKPTFVGSIKDLMKSKIDEVILRPVNNDGKTLEGCTTSGQNKTWIEWKLDKLMNDRLEKELNSARAKMEDQISNEIKKYLDDYKDTALKNQVANFFESIKKIKEG